ncbi:MAG: hypothetical protein JWR26_1655 [Pedosphaera sp.]|nr:hypothetical protein [Pedosphaera sp.]
MAQVTGGTTFDFVARRKHDAARKVLSRAADIWAARGREALSIDSAIAVILRIVLSQWSEFGGLRQEVRTLENWLSLVGTARQEADGLLTTVAPNTVTEVLSLLQTEITFAADQWSLGNPEQPPTAHALNAVEHILFKHKLLTRPPSPKMPTSVRDAGQT